MKAIFAAHFATVDPVVAAIVPLVDHYHIGPRDDGTAFEVLARAIASQQLSGAVADRIIGRLIEAGGGTFPGPDELMTLSPETLRAAGFSFAKIAALKDLAAHALDGRLPDDATLAAMDDEAIIERCTAVRGIGRWTAQMLLMLHFGRPDVLPADDFGVRNGFRLAYRLKGLPKPKSLLAYAERWKPYRSAGAWYMWRAVDLHRQGLLPPRTGRPPQVEIAVPAAGANAESTPKRPLSKAARAPRR
jgi:DNA-3-methyladenine glycosylase II